MRALLLLGLLAACGGTTKSPLPDLATLPDQSAPADLAPAPDQSSPDDLASPADLAGGPIDGPGCRNDGDCRLYSSYCASAPCQCLVLGATDPDPPCNGGMVTCLVDPCQKFSAFCNNMVCDKK